ncbi:upstream stimulatory factor 2 isoform X2 [Agrilus planipennis]|uniref:Upstream stimulatory factor 2 isoform X2 n=1 Tax=Agrilus planipennis TaxID=224129 RepID=A0A1W4XER1_AGRPL|nr:upstream stimulatory factor 2 isoform X2 [Agrilus planipennis]
MDILHPLDNSEVDETETKVILHQDLNIVDEHSIGSDEDRVVEHLSPQTLLETPSDNNDVQYSFRSSEGTITYRVLQVDEGTENMSQIVSSSTNFTNPGVQQVLTSNLNGQLYVIGSPNDVFSNQSSTRAIAPRANIIDSGPAVAATMKKRDERRRATHNEVERRRRDKINNWITKLSKIIPESSTELKGNGHYDGQSKGGILAKACEYILELKKQNEKTELCIKENLQLHQSLEIISKKNEALVRENRALREMLKRSGIETPSEVIS